MTARSSAFPLSGGSPTVLASFNGSNGENPEAGVTLERQYPVWDDLLAAAPMLRHGLQRSH